jgi:nucleoside-diphosphate-sugar epimerase
MSGELAVVTGASGFVGSHIADELLRRGARVRCLLRPGSPTRWLDGKPIEVVRLDFHDLAALTASVRGAAWIVHAAGLTSARSAREFHDANVAGTERMLRAAMDAGGSLQRFLLVSSQAAAGPAVEGRPVTESERPDPVSPYGVSKLRSEELTMLLKDRLPVVAIRPPAVYGPRDRALLKLFLAVKLHLLPVLRGGGRFSLIYAEDLARAIALALTHPAAAGQVYFASEPDVTDYREAGECVKRALGTWAVSVTPPRFLLHAGALAGELWGLIRNRPPFLSRQKLSEIAAGDWVCSSEKIRSGLGWRPEVPLQEGIARTAAWYREAGWV